MASGSAGSLDVTWCGASCVVQGVGFARILGSLDVAACAVDAIEHAAALARNLGEAADLQAHHQDLEETSLVHPFAVLQTVHPEEIVGLVYGQHHVKHRMWSTHKHSIVPASSPAVVASVDVSDSYLDSCQGIACLHLRNLALAFPASGPYVHCTRLGVVRIADCYARLHLVRLHTACVDHSLAALLADHAGSIEHSASLVRLEHAFVADRVDCRRSPCHSASATGKDLVRVWGMPRRSLCSISHPEQSRSVQFGTHLARCRLATMTSSDPL